MKCRSCGAAVEAWRPICDACGAATALADPPTTLRLFRDSRSLTRWVQGLLLAGMVLNVISSIASFVAMGMLRDIVEGNFASEAAMIAAADAMDFRQQVIGYSALGLTLATIVVFGMWIYRACANVRALGAPNLQFTPGWSIGSFFVPFVNLWVPYQAMCEIMRASRNPANWEAEKAGALVGWWWFFWLVRGVVYVAAGRIGASSGTVEELSAGLAWIAGAQMLDLVSSAIALILVRSIHRHQSSASDRALSAIFA